MSKILVIDDDSFFIDVICMTLERGINYEIITGNSLKETGEALKADFAIV